MSSAREIVEAFEEVTHALYSSDPAPAVHKIIAQREALVALVEAGGRDGE